MSAVRRSRRRRRCCDCRLNPRAKSLFSLLQTAVMTMTESRSYRTDLKSRSKPETRYLEHVRIAVVRVLHHHHLDSGQSVRDAVLVFVAYGLKGHRLEKTD